MWHLLLLLVWFQIGLPTFVAGWTWTSPLKQPSVSSLLQENAQQIAQLKSVATEELKDGISKEPYSNDVFFLRYCLQFGDSEDPQTAAHDCLIQNLQWRSSPKGQRICTAALDAVQKATATAGSWDNEPVFANAPHSTAIGAFLTPEKCLTTTTGQDDLIYCIRAGQIDDVSLMERVSVDELTDFFLYAKEVNYLVSLQRSVDTDKMVSVLTANDLSGVKLIGGSADLRKALGASSKESDALYPATNGPTLLLNLPAVLNALVKLFTPLFPDSVKARLRFEQGPLKDIQQLVDIAKPGSSERNTFLEQIDSLVYKD